MFESKLPTFIPKFAEPLCAVSTICAVKAELPVAHTTLNWLFTTPPANPVDVFLFTPVVILLNNLSPDVTLLPLNVCNLIAVKSPVGPAPKRVTSNVDTTPLALVSAIVLTLVTPTDNAGGSISKFIVEPVTKRLPLIIWFPTNVLLPVVATLVGAFNANDAVTE